MKRSRFSTGNTGIQKCVQNLYITVCFFFILVLASGHTSANVNTTNTDQWGVTQINLAKLNYLWTINDFSLFNQKTGNYFESPIFSSVQYGQYNWSLRLYPNGANNNTNYISIFLNYKSGLVDIVDGDFKISLLNATYNEIKNVSGKQIKLYKGGTYGSNTFITRDDVFKRKGVLRNDTLTIYAELTLYTGTTNFSGDCKVRNENLQSHQISDHLEQFLENEVLSDVILVVKDKELPAHKVIMSARSTVFAMIFANNTKQTIIGISDVDLDVMKEILRYMYTGRLRNLKKMAEQFLSAANIYGIDGLKNIAVEEICKSVNVENAIDILLLAVRHSSDSLKSKAVHFIAAHAADFIRTPAFKELETSHPDLIIEIFNAMVNNGFK